MSQTVQVHLPYKIEELVDWLELTRNQEIQPWLLDGLIPAQGIVILSGRQKKEGHKSWLARLMAVAMASGKTYAGLTPSGPVHTWYIDREGAPKLTAEAWDMLARGMGIDFEDTRGRLKYTSMGAFFLTEKAHVDAACRYVAAHGIKCVIIDTLAKSFIGDENSSEIIGAALRNVAKIQNAGAAVVLVHHLRKGQLSIKGGEPTPDEDLRGSGALAGGFDMHLAVRRYPSSPEMFLLYGGKYAPPRAAELAWDIRDVKSPAGTQVGTAVLSMNQIDYPQMDEDDA